MESAMQVLVKIEPSWDSVSVEYAPSIPVFIKDEPPSDGSVEVRSSCLDVSVKEEILNTEASCSNASETPLDVTVKVERVKEECGVSARAAAEGLYAGHAVTGELVLGPTLVERRELLSRTKERAPQEEQGKSLDPYHCNHCGFTTARKSAIAGHIKTHASHDTLVCKDEYTEKPYTCDQCSYTTAVKYSLLKQEKIQTGLIPYKCDQCSYVAVQTIGLLAHKRIIHTVEKPYKCGQCSYATDHKSHLKVHDRIHTGDRPYKCNRCNYAAVSKSHLIVHERIHTGDKPYKCHQCNFAAGSKSSLIKHERIHTGERPYKCNRCSYAAVSKSHLIVHDRIHTGKKLYKCDRCSFISAHKAAKRRHARLHSVE